MRSNHTTLQAIEMWECCVTRDERLILERVYKYPNSPVADTLLESDIGACDLRFSGQAWALQGPDWAALTEAMWEHAMYPRFLVTFNLTTHPHADTFEIYFEI